MEPDGLDQELRDLTRPSYIQFDEHGWALCRMPVVTWESSEVTGRPVPLLWEECGEEVVVIWQHSVPLSRFTTPHGSAAVHDLTIASCWEATCAAGHVLATSSSEEMAEPFVPSLLWPGFSAR